MKQRATVFLLKFIVAAAVGLLGVPSALAADAACAPIMAAMQRLAITPNHQYMTQTAAFEKTPKTSEIIITHTTMYLQVAGKWQSRPYDPKKSAQELATAGDAPGMSCQAEGDETVDGQLARVFRTRQKMDDGEAVDGQLWLSKSTELPLRQTIDMNVGGKFGKSHTEERFEYADVQAPVSK